MKLPNSEEFNFKDITVACDDCWLITPNGMGTDWTDDNAHFRSCIITKNDHRVVSLGFKKFTNIFEKPDFQPWNSDWNFTARRKIDGSLLCISKYKGELITRTRGTQSVRTLPNGHEIAFLMEKYPKVFDNEHLDSEDWSILVEWTTPTNIICLREHEEPTLTLLGMISHHTLNYETQKHMDYLGTLWDIPRPEAYEYASLEECINDVKMWEGKEGVIIYSADEQTLKKIKADLYLKIHKLATGIRNISNVLDVFMESPRSYKYEDFKKFIEDTMDYEIALKVDEDIHKITEAYGKFIHSVNTIERAMGYISKLDSRKKQAMAIQEHWDGFMIPCAFQLLDNKPLDDKLVKKSMEKLLGI
jgi:hypothetical protein